MVANPSSIEIRLDWDDLLTSMDFTVAIEKKGWFQKFQEKHQKTEPFIKIIHNQRRNVKVSQGKV